MPGTSQQEAAVLSPRQLREKEAARAFLRSGISHSELALETASRRLEDHAKRTMKKTPLTSCVILCPTVVSPAAPAVNQQACMGEPVAV
jgi:hypothetical protein